MIRLAAALLLLTGSGFATAGQFNPQLTVGDPAPAWTDLPGVDGARSIRWPT